MTEFEKLCDELDNILAIDRDVLAMLIISLAGKRHIVASCSSISYAEDYLKAALTKLIINIFGLIPLVVSCTHDSTWNNISSKIATASSVILIKDLQTTSKYVQAYFLDSIIKKVVISGQTCTILSPNLCVIALQSSDDQRTFIDPLKDHFLLKNILSSELRSPLQDVRNIVKAANISTLVAPSPIIEQSYFDEICNKGQDITLVPDIRQYMQDIVLFLRNHRLVSKGVSPKSVKDFEFLVRMLSVLHDYDFATPSLVAIAAKKLFPFRIQVCHPIDEPTLKYGGDIKIVAQWMKKWDSELIVEDIINCVPPPL